MDTRHAVRLEDYTPPPFLVDRIDLRFDIAEPETHVGAQLSIRRNPASTDPGAPLELDGSALALDAVRVDGRTLAPHEFRVETDKLVISNPPDACTVEIDTRIRPSENTSLEGLYRAESAYCTQCEAEGFRKMTYFPDRPDVMATYSTTIVADRETCPVLLSNGNPVSRGETEDGRHWMTWEDPFPKPSYLFALVAGDLACVEDTFTTCSGRELRLRIYVERHNIDRCDHAMRSLKRAMAWDEQTFGLEYDLDLYMIVAVDDFNMGAMENKGLNVFNSKYVLASPDTATDTDFTNIEAVVAHEYFHNWTGNRVTCRDWFQLSLKEGLTVFRDQEFSADQGSRAVKRIQDARVLRTAQFAEDAGPMAHPVRPDTYIEINNFYTVTVYNKGAEVIRMIHTLIGAAAFRRGMDLYFERHDGQAVTTEDFVSAMADASGVDLAQFQRWYDQAGTPELTVLGEWHEDTETFTLELAQSCPATPGQTVKQPFHIPVTFALLDSTGQPMPVTPTEGILRRGPNGDAIAELRERRTRFELRDVRSEPRVSALRNFSAPVKIRNEYRDEELAFLFAHDNDPFNRWDAGQTLLTQCLLRNIERHQAGEPMQVDQRLIEAVRRTLRDSSLDGAFIAEAITVPSESYLSEQVESIDIDAIHAARSWLRGQIAESLADDFLASYRGARSNAAYRYDAASVARRALGNVSLGYLAELGTAEVRSLCTEQATGADNMTDSIAGLTALANMEGPERSSALAEFEARWHLDSLVMDKWFSVQATSRLPGTLEEVQALLAHPGFDLRKPNKVRALIGAFCQANPVRFHAADGAGYAFLTTRVLELEPMNPQVAARLLGAFRQWRRFPEPRRGLMRASLERILATQSLSADVYEVASKTLG